jgi:PKD repeat protein
MKIISNYTKRFIVLLLATVFLLAANNNLQAQSCNQVEILCNSFDCFEKSNSAVGGTDRGCKETGVCVGQASPYTSSLGGVGWTYNWTATGPTAVTISPSNTQAVSITWPQVGVYTLTLTATDPSGNIFTTCLTVHVKDKPIANFTFTPNNVCQNSTIAFTGTSTFSSSFMSYWNFGDSPSGSSNFQTAIGNTPVSHLYSAAGSYWVTLITSSFSVVIVPSLNGAKDTIIKTCCSDTIKKQVTILSGTIKIECVSTVCAGSTSTYTVVGCANPTVTVTGNTSVTQSGNQITVVWGSGTPQGEIQASCPGGCTASVPVPIIPTTPQIIGNINPCNTSIASYSLPLFPGTFYTWTLLNTTNGNYYNSAISTYPDNNTVWINWGSSSLPAGVYQLGITLENKHICCRTTGSLTITPRGKWKPFSDQTICAGAAASLSATAGGTYTWTVLPPNAGVTPTSGTGAPFVPVPTFANGGVYAVQFIETSGIFCNSGAANPQQIKVTVRPALVAGAIVGPSTVCAGSQYDYNMSTAAPTGAHYEWTITSGAGTFMPSGTPPIMGDNVTIQWTTIPGTISVILKYNDFPYCPVGPITKTVTAATVGSIGGPQNVCVDDEYIYTLTGGTLPPGEVINWVISPSSLGSVILNNGTSTPKIKWHGMVAGAGPWTATLQATTNCGNSALYTITISRPPVFNLTQTGNICMGGVNLSATNTPGYTYSWSPGVHPPTSTINVTTTGTYTCTVTNGTCTKSKTITVYDPFAILPIQECGGPHCNGLATSEQLQISVIKPASGTFTYEWFKQYPTLVSVSGPVTNTNLSNIYMAADSGYYFVVVTYGSCKDTAYYYVQKECCPDVNTPVITTVRNSCKQFTFTGTTPNPTGASITWSFGDGITQPGVSGVPVTHTYVNAGSYCVTFCVGSPSPNPTNCYGNCAGTNVIIPIQAKFEYVIGCNGCVQITNLSTAIPLSGSSLINYDWNFGDGFDPPPSSSPIPPNHCYTVAGTYNITLTINFKDVTIPLVCSDTYTLPVTFTPLSITVNPTPVCSGNLVTFTSTPGGFASYAWNFGDTYSSYTSPTTHAYTTPSPPTYNVILSVVDLLGVTCTATKPFTVLPGITSCTILPAFICPGSAATLTAPAGAYTYLWQVETSPGVFANASGANTVATYNTTVPGFYHVIVTNSNGCTCTSNKAQVKAVTKPKALIAASPSTKLCGPSSVTLNSVNNLTGFTSDWFQNNVYGTPLYTGQNWYIPTLSTTTVFNLVLTNQYGCKDTCTFTVYVNPIPAQPIIAAPALLCEGVPITLSVTNYASNITWSNGATTTSITVVAAGTYTATYTNPATGCTSSQTVTIHPRPSTKLFPHFCDSIKCTCRNPEGTFTVYAPKPLVGFFASPFNIAWYYNGNLVGANANNPLFNPALTGSYYVILTNPITGCKDTSNVYSVVVPPCDTCDCKESHWGEISLSATGVAKLDNGKNKTNVKEKNTKIANNPSPNTVLDCKGVYTIKCNQPYTINANYICKDTSCPSKVTYSLLLPNNSVQTGNVPYSFTPILTGNYALTMYGWCGGKICDSCLITFKVDCDTVPKNCCEGSVWEEAPWYSFDKTGKKKEKINCTEQEQVLVITGDLCKQPLTFGGVIKCPADCKSIDSVFIYDGGNVPIQSGVAPYTITALPNGAYTVEVIGYCGGLPCLKCRIILKIDCKEKECDCKGSSWAEHFYTINNVSTQIDCKNKKPIEVKCKIPISINAFYNCADATCNGNVTYTLIQPSGTTTGNVPLTFTPSVTGTYTVTLYGWCGSRICDSCVVTFRTVCVVDTACCPYAITVTPKVPTYTAGTGSTIVSNNYAITIPATANIAEVRANVVSYTIDDDFKGDCMKCINLPFTWASIATATNINTAPPKITMYGGATVPSFNGSGAGAYQNPREVIWNNGSNLNAPNITNIGMSFILPPTPAIDCCKLKGRICVKFTFRDNDCKECEVIACFDFVIKK